jgi:hypothetical protein
VTPLYWRAGDDYSHKFLAHCGSPFEALVAMNQRARSNNVGRGVVAVFVSAAFLWALTLIFSPQLHARVHPDGNRAEHSCAVTLIATGSCEHGAHPPLVAQPQFTDSFSKIAALSSTWVRPLFLSSHIFAHAPPATA